MVVELLASSNQVRHTCKLTCISIDDAVVFNNNREAFPVVFHPIMLLLVTACLLAQAVLLSWATVSAGSECGGGMVVRVDAGDLILEDGSRQHVGMYTSQLQDAVINALYPEVVNSRDISPTTFFNSDNLCYLDLSGS